MLSDLEMPRCSGIEFITRVREMEASGELSKTHIVFAITGNARQGQIDRCALRGVFVLTQKLTLPTSIAPCRALEAGMNDIILKPYRIGDVSLTLRSRCPSSH